MKMTEMTLLEWQNRFGSEDACLEELIHVRWPDGFYCPACACKEYSFITPRKIYQCANCHRQTSAIAGTIFHSTNLPLVKWFWAIYLCASDKGGISALRLSKHIGVSWITAQRMLRKIRKAMADRDSIYRLTQLIELDDAYIGGKKTGKRGRGAEGKTPIIVAVENLKDHAGFMAAETVKQIDHQHVERFLHRHLATGQKVRTDGFHSLNVVKKEHEHQRKVTPPEKAGTWLPLVHIVIGNLKTFINGTFHCCGGRW